MIIADTSEEESENLYLSGQISTFLILDEIFTIPFVTKLININNLILLLKIIFHDDDYIVFFRKVLKGQHS